MKVHIWPTHRVKSIRQTWPGVQPRRQKNRVALKSLRLDRMFRSRNLLKSEDRVTKSPNRETPLPDSKVYCFRLIIPKSWMVLSRDIVLCRLTSNILNLQIENGNICYLLQNHMKPFLSNCRVEKLIKV